MTAAVEVVDIDDKQACLIDINDDPDDDDCRFFLLFCNLTNMVI